MMLSEKAIISILENLQLTYIAVDHPKEPNDVYKGLSMAMDKIVLLASEMEKEYSQRPSFFLQHSECSIVLLCNEELFKYLYSLNTNGKLDWSKFDLIFLAKVFREIMKILRKEEEQNK